MDEDLDPGVSYEKKISKDLAMTLWGYRQTTFHEKCMRRLNRVARMNNVGMESTTPLGAPDERHPAAWLAFFEARKCEPPTYEVFSICPCC
jgi:hypothetical protein